MATLTTSATSPFVDFVIPERQEVLRFDLRRTPEALDLLEGLLELRETQTRDAFLNALYCVADHGEPGLRSPAYVVLTCIYWGKGRWERFPLALAPDHHVPGTAIVWV